MASGVDEFGTDPLTQTMVSHWGDRLNDEQVLPRLKAFTNTATSTSEQGNRRYYRIFIFN
ncbi:hypothetical protein GCM10028805_41330 [Spirosoma harenae]